MKTDYKVVDGVLTFAEGRTEIKSHEFHKKNYSKVIIPEGVTKIGPWGFGSCAALEEVVLPKTLVSISAEAFALCSNLKTVVFTDGCPKLKEVSPLSFPVQSPWLRQLRETEGPVIFGSILFLYGKGSDSVTIPEGITIISEAAFGEHESLSDVKFPKNLETIGKSAFSNCSKLKEIILPEKLKTIEKRAFFNCSSLERVSLPAALKSIDEDAFGRWLPDKSYQAINVKVLEGLIPAMLNGCKLDNKTLLWLLENEWKDESSIREIAVVYLTQHGTTVLKNAELLLWRYREQAAAAMNELRESYQLKPAVEKKITEYFGKT